MKKIFIGIIIGAMLMLAGQVYGAEVASHVGKRITNEYTITVDGKDLGVKAIVVDGVSHTPNRAIVEAMGGDVKFVDKTVVITTEKSDPAGGGSVETSTPTDQAARIRDSISSVESSIKSLNKEVELIEKSLLTYPEGESKERLKAALEDKRALIKKYEDTKVDLEAKLQALEAQQ